MTRKEKPENKPPPPVGMPSSEEVARELGKATSIDDFYGKDGNFGEFTLKAYPYYWTYPYRATQWFINE